MLWLGLINSLRGVRLRWVARWGAVVIFILLAVYCYLQHILLARSEIVYRNPQIVEHIRELRVEGPVRIVTRVVETPGRVEREMLEERGAVSVIRDYQKTSGPVFPTEHRLSRWLLGAGLDPLNYRESKYWSAYGGYSFGNRLDLFGGVSSGRPAILAVWRF